jgi:hypothetical protein
MTVCKVAEEVGVSTGSCHTILMEDLRIHRVSVKFAPRLFTDDQKHQHISICENLKKVNEDIFLKTSSPVMRHAFTVMKLTSNNNLHSGRVPLHFAPKKHDKFTEMRKQR